MKRVIVLLVCVGVMGLELVLGESFRVKGKVIGEEGNEGLIGVGMMEEGSNNGVIREIEGNYWIEMKGVGEGSLV